MKKLNGFYFCLIAVLLAAVLCFSGCTEGKSESEAARETIKVSEDNSFTYYEKYADYQDYGFLKNATELTTAVGERWFGEGSFEEISEEQSFLLEHSVSAHTDNGRGVLAVHNPGSAGMSQIDFILLTTNDYGKTWNSSGGVYHVVGSVDQIAINGDYVYVIVNSGTGGSSDLLVSEDFGTNFRLFTAEDIVPAKYSSRMSDFYNLYMRIVNVENSGEIVLEFYCDGYMEVEEGDSFDEYKNSFISDEETVIMILKYNAQLSEVNTLYADESFF